MLRRKDIKTKIRRADKVKVYLSPKTDKLNKGIFILAYKQESQGYQSDYERIPVVYFLGINMEKEFWGEHKISGKNIEVIEKEMARLQEVSFNPDLLLMIDTMPDARTWRLNQT